MRASTTQELRLGRLVWSDWAADPSHPWLAIGTVQGVDAETTLRAWQREHASVTGCGAGQYSEPGCSHSRACWAVRNPGVSRLPCFPKLPRCRGRFATRRRSGRYWRLAASSATPATTPRASFNSVREKVPSAVPRSSSSTMERVCGRALPRGSSSMRPTWPPGGRKDSSPCRKARAPRNPRVGATP